ncbi:MAG: type I 3-dehydroquinate dehydratase [Chlamydiota bacterium]
MTLLFGGHPGPELPDPQALLPHLDGIELRLDQFAAIDFAAIGAFIKDSPVPVMLTLRKKEQGGAFQGTEEERLDLISTLCTLHPHYLDLEWDVPTEFRRRIFDTFSRIQILSSYHNFEETPPDLEALYKKVKSPYAHLTKIATTARSTSDALRMLSFVRSKEKIVGICMGEAGELTRVLAPVAGNHLTYAKLEGGLGTASGQINSQELQELYRFRSLNRDTAVFALIGDPVDKSRSALFHNPIFREKNVNAVYVKIPLKKEELTAFFKWTDDFPVKGLSVTMPHKESVIPFLDVQSPEVLCIGACNTIKLDGKRRGFNTDGVGALNAIENKGSMRDKHLVVVGAGGTAKAIIYEAMQRGAQVTVLNRTHEKAIALAAQLHCRAESWDRFPEVVNEG